MRKVLETLVVQELGIFETLGSKNSHGASKKIADVRTHFRKVSKKIILKRASALFSLPSILPKLSYLWYNRAIIDNQTPLKTVSLKDIFSHK